MISDVLLDAERITQYRRRRGPEADSERLPRRRMVTSRPGSQSMRRT
jgi:hypothetical protein